MRIIAALLVGLLAQTAHADSRTVPSRFQAIGASAIDPVTRPVFLLAQAVDPVTGATVGGLYTKTTGGVVELFYIDSAGNVSQLTNAGGGQAVTGSGTTNFVPLWTSASALGNSIMQQSGGGIGALATLAGPVFQAVNNGAGNAVEAYGSTGGALLTDSLRTTGHSALIKGSHVVFPYNEFADTALEVDGGMTLKNRAGTVTGVNGTGNTIWFSLEAAAGGNFPGPYITFYTGVNINDLLGYTDASVGSGVGTVVFQHNGAGAPAVQFRSYAGLYSTNNGQAANPIPFGDSVRPWGTGTFQNLSPASDNSGSIGTNATRWASVRAVTVTTGDLGFEDQTCPVCGKSFEVDDDVVWRIRSKEKDGSLRSVPVHSMCALRTHRKGAAR